MDFLVFVRARDSVPLDMAMSLTEATEAWVSRQRAGGKVQALWGLAGIIGAAGVFKVDSTDELDEIMSTFPFRAFSAVEIIALSDMERSLAHSKAQIGRMMAQVGSAS
jgi:muconolactone delta-isomerase